MSTETTQPNVFYPNSMTVQPPPPQPSHSNGSFGAVFIVLAVIVVVSGIACFLGRFCNRRSTKTQSKPHGHKQQQHDKKPKSKPKGKESDIEFGFEPSKRITAVRPLSSDSEPRGFRVHGNGAVRGEPAPPADPDHAAGEQQQLKKADA